MSALVFMEAIRHAEAKGFTCYAAALRIELAKVLAANRRAKS